MLFQLNIVNIEPDRVILNLSSFFLISCNLACVNFHFGVFLMSLSFRKVKKLES